MVGGKQGESGKRKNEIVSFLYYYFYQSSFTEFVVGVDEYNYSPAEMVIASNLSVNESESFDLLLFFILLMVNIRIFDIILLTVRFSQKRYKDE